MSNRRLEVFNIQELVRLHRMGCSVREVARLLGISPNTERLYRRALLAAGLLEGNATELPSMEAIVLGLEEHLPSKLPPQQESTVMPWKASIKEMLERGAGPKAIYDALRLIHDDFGASLSAVKRFCRRMEQARGVRATDVVIPVETSPGAEAQVDFGYVGKLFDPVSGRLRKAYAFAMILSYSRHMYAKVVFDQKVATWLRLHVEAFEYFGGVPQVLVPDNLKAAVVRAAFGVSESTALNRSYCELARHYRFKIDPTPPYSPNKKGKVERAIRYLKGNFFKPREFDDIDQANTELFRWLLEIAGKRTHGTTGKQPMSSFEQEEKSELLSLPQKRYQLVSWRKGKVHRDCHVSFDGRLYSVPWRFCGQTVWVRATPHTIEIYCETKLITDHFRQSNLRRLTKDGHLPPKREAYRHRLRSYWEDKADGLAESVGQYIREAFEQEDELSMLRPVQAMVTMLQQYPVHRAVAACERARYFGNYSYRALKRILLNALDQEPLTEGQQLIKQSENLRYARRPKQWMPQKGETQ